MKQFKERIKRLEKIMPVATDETRLDKALEVVLREAPTHELMIATGSGKYGSLATIEQQEAMCMVLLKRARAKVR